MKSLTFICLVFVILFDAGEIKAQQNRRFFSDDSFWNQPLPENPKIHPKSDKWMQVLSQEPGGAYFGINTDTYTIPVYETDENTPTYTIYNRPVNENFRKVHGYRNNWFATHDFYGHGKGFGKNVPIPVNAVSDPEEDSHIVMVDWKSNLVWDVWGLEIVDGKYYSFTGMKYKANGSGVFNPKDFKVKNGESIHFYGPGRAAGVPVVAGLILYDEAMNGEIRHKLAAATRYNAYQEYVFPAIWTDGMVEGSIPEGSVIQLDPKLDLSQFDLTPQEKAVAVAAQKYGMVIVDNAGGNVIYAQGLYKNSPVNWDGKLRGWKAGIIGIPIKHYRVIQTGNPMKGGLYSEELDKTYLKIDHEKLRKILE